MHTHQNHFAHFICMLVGALVLVSLLVINHDGRLASSEARAIVLARQIASLEQKILGEMTQIQQKMDVQQKHSHEIILNRIQTAVNEKQGATLTQIASLLDEHDETQNTAIVETVLLVKQSKEPMLEKRLLDETKKATLADATLIMKQSLEISSLLKAVLKQMSISDTLRSNQVPKQSNNTLLPAQLDRDGCVIAKVRRNPSNGHLGRKWQARVQNVLPKASPEFVCPSIVNKRNWLSGESYDDEFKITHHVSPTAPYISIERNDYDVHNWGLQLGPPREQVDGGRW